MKRATSREAMRGKKFTEGRKTEKESAPRREEGQTKSCVTKDCSSHSIRGDLLQWLFAGYFGIFISFIVLRLHNRLPKKNPQHKQDDRAKTSHSRKAMGVKFLYGPALRFLCCFLMNSKRKTAEREVNLKSSQPLDCEINWSRFDQFAFSLFDAPEPPTRNRYQPRHISQPAIGIDTWELLQGSVQLISIDFTFKSTIWGLLWVENSKRTTMISCWYRQSVLCHSCCFACCDPTVESSISWQWINWHWRICSCNEQIDKLGMLTMFASCRCSSRSNSAQKIWAICHERLHR